jgi:hypothetical protein
MGLRGHGSLGPIRARARFRDGKRTVRQATLLAPRFQLLAPALITDLLLADY